MDGGLLLTIIVLLLVGLGINEKLEDPRAVITDLITMIYLEPQYPALVLPMLNFWTVVSLPRRIAGQFPAD